MAVVAAFKLDDRVASGKATREADGAHRGLGARTHQSHHVEAGQHLAEQFGYLDLASVGAPKDRPFERRLLYRANHRWMSVTGNRRAPGAHVVDVGSPVGIPYPAALGALDEAGRAADRAKSPYRRS